MRLALARTGEDPEVKGVEEEDPITVAVAGAVIKNGAKPLSGEMYGSVSFHQEVLRSEPPFLSQ
jgi:hypothetical protein